MGAQGTASLTFGVFPGASDASVAVTGQTGILAGSLVEAWIFPAATADHTADEHWVETIQVVAGNVVAGTGFTIYGRNTNQVNEPVVPIAHEQSVTFNGPSNLVYKTAPPNNINQGGGKGTLLYGAFNIAWVWN